MVMSLLYVLQVKQHDDAQAKGLSSEIYLTRLLATKVRRLFQK
jgi:hypothetical protein